MSCGANMQTNILHYTLQLTVERSPEQTSARTTPPSTMRHHKMAKYPNIPQVHACVMLQNPISFVTVGEASEKKSERGSGREK